MANVLINVKVEADGVVTLSDNYGGDSGSEESFTTEVALQDNVTWTITTELGDTNVELLQVVKKEGSTDVFLEDPRNNSNGTITGIIGDAPAGTEESYSIVYTVNGEVKTIDPQLILKKKK